MNHIASLIKSQAGQRAGHKYLRRIDTGKRKPTGGIITKSLANLYGLTPSRA